MKKKKAICYYRVSSEQQAKKQSIDMQKLRLKEFAEEKGYEIVADFEDDGISGESIELRPGFQETLATIEEGGVDVLLVFMIDRIGRFAVRKDRNRVIELLESSHTNVDSPYHGLFRWDNEKELNDLEGALNESRLDNKMRAIMISEGHLRVRRNGGFSGGRVPYGLRYDKKNKKFYPHPKEYATLKVIFNKLRGGWGLLRTAEFLSQDLKKYPLPTMKKIYRKDHPVRGIKRGDPKPAIAWNPATLRSFVSKDFYFTGIIAPAPASAKKGLLPVDTKTRLFTEQEVKAARNEMRIRRWPSKSKDPVKTDMIFLGHVQCAYCGWKLGPHYTGYKKGKPSRICYRCRGTDTKRSTGCEFKNVLAPVLDKTLWLAFIKRLEDPDTLEKLILKEEFIVNKDRVDLEEMRATATATLEEFKARNDRFNWLVIEGLMSKEQRLELSEDIKIRRREAEERLEKANTALRRPQDIKHAVKRAIQVVADQMQVMWCLEQIKELNQRASRMVESANADRAIAGDSEEENLRALLKQLDAAKMHEEVLDLSLKIIEDLKKNREAPTADDLSNKDILQLIFQQKRLILQKFIDPERRIQVWSKDKFEIHLSIPKSVSDEENSKQIKSF